MTDEVMLETTMRDWRCAEGMEDAVRPEHRGEFKVKISRTGYGGLMIDLETPQGEAHSVLIEADEGVVKLLTFTADTEERGWTKDEPDTRIFLTSFGTRVEEDHGVFPTVMLFRAEQSAERIEGAERRSSEHKASLN